MHRRMHERGNHRFQIILPEILPRVFRVILHRVVQEPHAPARAAHQFLHDTVFQKGSFKGALVIPAGIHIAAARCARPHLRNAAVHRGDIQKRPLRAQDFPLSVIEQRVRGYIEPEIAAVFFFCVGFQLAAHILYQPLIEIDLERGGFVAVFAGQVRRLPVLAVKIPVFPFEAFAVAAFVPEFRFFQMHGLHALIHRWPQLLRQIAAKSL